VLFDAALHAGTHMFCGHYHRNSLARYEGPGGSLEMVCFCAGGWGLQAFAVSGL